MATPNELKSVYKALVRLEERLARGIAAEVLLNADLDTAVTNEAAVNAEVDLIRVSIGTPAGASSIAEQSVLLWAQLEA